MLDLDQVSWLVEGRGEMNYKLRKLPTDFRLIEPAHNLSQLRSPLSASVRIESACDLRRANSLYKGPYVTLT